MHDRQSKRGSARPFRGVEDRFLRHYRGDGQPEGPLRVRTEIVPSTRCGHSPCVPLRAVSTKRELSNSERRQAGCGCFLLTLLLAVAALNSLRDVMCETTTYTESRSPSGRIVARVQMTDCGATTGFSRVVWVQPTWLPRDRAISCRALALDNQPSVRLAWTDDALIVTTDAPPESVSQVRAVATVGLLK